MPPSMRENHSPYQSEKDDLKMTCQSAHMSELTKGITEADTYMKKKKVISRKTFKPTNSYTTWWCKTQRSYSCRRNMTENLSNFDK